MDMNDLVGLVEIWAKDKGLDEADPKAQYLKVSEECGEIAAALARSNEEELKDAIGDTMVTLIILALQKGLSAEECLEEAYSVIKKRKGKMVDGVFVKAEDLAEEAEEARSFKAGDIVYLVGGKNAEVTPRTFLDHPSNPLLVKEDNNGGDVVVYEKEERRTQIVNPSCLTFDAPVKEDSASTPEFKAGDFVYLKGGHNSTWTFFKHPERVLTITRVLGDDRAEVLEPVQDLEQTVQLENLIPADVAPTRGGFKVGDIVYMKGLKNRETCFEYPKNPLQITDFHTAGKLIQVWEPSQGLYQLVFPNEITFNINGI